MKPLYSRHLSRQQVKCRSTSSIELAFRQSSNKAMLRLLYFNRFHCGKSYSPLLKLGSSILFYPYQLRQCIFDPDYVP